MLRFPEAVGLRADRTAVGLSDLLDDQQIQAGPPDASAGLSLDAMAFGEEGRQMFCSDARAGGADFEMICAGSVCSGVRRPNPPFRNISTEVLHTYLRMLY